MDTIPSITAMQSRSERERGAGRRVALVPTMGYLHEGHLSLVREARGRADVVVVSLFVNKIQFNDARDFDSYPRDLGRDARMLESVGADVLFAPEHEDMYPRGFRTSVEVDGITERLCGAFRPGHFRGVTTVVAKLFHATRPHVAIFGEKDYQQLVTIRTMARDLNMGIEVIGLPTVREPDGLAMSSRNVRLTPEQRELARAIPDTLFEAAKRVRGGEKDAAGLAGWVRERLARTAQFRVEYVEIVDAEDLAPLTELVRPARLAIALHLGHTRLIDNVALDPA
ncbi:MAG: pantoate--beta-alanine ligase [Deltaproteobacteria bacterium]|nr:pantoate--beta-alanine ligase [Deltaproteobacteria bacterium]